MAVTRAQEASTSQAVTRPPRAEQPEANLPVSRPVQPQVHQADRLDALTHQVQDLMAVVRGLQEQHSTAAPAPPQSPPPRAEGHGASRPDRGRTPPEASRHSPQQPRRRSTSKRRRSPSCHSGRSRRQHGEKEPRRVHPHRQRPSPSSSSESLEDINKKSSRRAEQRLDEYHQRLEELSRRIAIPSEMDYNHRPPLSRRIMEEPVPHRFRLPQLDPYDGTTDPLDHLESYKVLMQVQGATDSLLCIAFPATLRKAARAWYSRLPPRSMHSFRQLERSFLAHFDAC